MTPVSAVNKVVSLGNQMDEPSLTQCDPAEIDWAR